MGEPLFWLILLVVLGPCALFAGFEIWILVRRPAWIARLAWLPVGPVVRVPLSPGALDAMRPAGADAYREAARAEPDLSRFDWPERWQTDDMVLQRITGRARFVARASAPSRAATATSFVRLDAELEGSEVVVRARALPSMVMLWFVALPWTIVLVAALEGVTMTHYRCPLVWDAIVGAMLLIAFVDKRRQLAPLAAWGVDVMSGWLDHGGDVDPGGYTPGDRPPDAPT